MATIKSYTDLAQSKKLAEILPIKSADMRYKEYTSSLDYSSKHCDVPSIGFPHSKDVPCWSLTALLELLPKRLEIVDNVYELSVYLYGLYYWNINNGNLCFESKDKDNLVDACYEMILKLHELNLL